jgi:tetratricopeptide (TPR) repeat protein
MSRFTPCLVLFAFLHPAVLQAGPPAEDERVPMTLLVQAALQQGRECVGRGEFRTAVRVLEAQLPKINGNAIYLQVLEQAYRGYVQELKEKGQDELAQRYLERLAILDPGVMLASAVRPTIPTKESPAVEKTASTPPPAPPTAPAPSPVNQALARADQEFQAKHYYEAATLYQRAFESDQQLSQVTRERWAYCKLHSVTQQLNEPNLEASSLAALEDEVRSALRLAPRLEYGKRLLTAIQERTNAGKTTKSQYQFQHLARKQEGWQVAESANFRVFHHDPALAERALQTAEDTRAQLTEKWLGEQALAPWATRCDIYLHASAEAYCRATGVPGDSPGHSSIGAEREDAARIHSRRIDLHTDDQHMLRAVLPHETTHVVLAGHYGRLPLPRWADEGLAILSEPPDRIQRHLKVLPQAFEEGRVFGVGQLLELTDYPAPQFMHSFYGQGVSLVQYLTNAKGPRVFTEFLRGAQREGYEASLRRHYGLRDYGDLEQRWMQAVQAEQNAAAGR